MKKLLFVLIATSLVAAERPTDPTFLHRYLPDIAISASDVSTETCHYKAAFGQGSSAAGSARGVARFGEIDVDPSGACAPVQYAAEEQIYLVLEGSGQLSYGAEKVPLRKDDYAYLPPGIRHAASNNSGQTLRLIVMGFKIPASTTITVPEKLQMANLGEVKHQTVDGHPTSVLYELLLGDRKSTRDKIAAGLVVTSLFIMDFEPGGTNGPHHHDTEEEIYLVLDGHGDMVAGGGMDGVEGRHAAKPGDAYFFRLNCTVGFYNAPDAKARILAVRSLYPFGRRKD